MHRRSRVFCSMAVAALSVTSAAFAQTDTQTPPVDSTSPAAPVGDSAPVVEPGAAQTDEAAVAAPNRDPSAPIYGIAARWRYIMVPGWFLDFFTQKNSPLYTPSSFGLEGFRRKVDKDDPNRTWELTVGVGYQNMSPPDAYWLGKGKDKAVDTDLVQVRDLSLITMDAAFVSRQYFNKYFGIHYGAGLGLGIVRGKVLRTSAQANADGTFQVKDNGTGQQYCGADPRNCNEQKLNQSSGKGGDQASEPHRFQETSVPGALPIINLLLGIDIRAPLPNGQALEFRVEGGFFDAFFIGTTIGYQI
jgi:hypothetical protein